jgi:hypothetical protein
MRRMLGVHTMPCRSGCPEAPCTADVGASPSRVYSASMSSCRADVTSEDIRYDVERPELLPGDVINDCCSWICASKCSLTDQPTCHVHSSTRLSSDGDMQGCPTWAFRTFCSTSATMARSAGSRNRSASTAYPSSASCIGHNRPSAKGQHVMESLRPLANSILMSSS